MNDTQKRTAVSTHVAAESIPLTQLERMATAMAKSGMFAAKTYEAALSLLLVSQAEGIHPAQALMDYDVIQGRPALKSAAMLARFQRSGGTVKWLQSTDDVAEADFSHPSGGTIRIKWDKARIAQAGLDGKDMHKKYPAQMKRARVISEAIRAIAPQSIPVGMYTTEETQDMIDVTPTVVQQANADLVEKLAERDDYSEHLDAIKAAGDQPALMAAFNVAWVHAKAAQDEGAKKRLKAAYDMRKGDLLAAVAQAEQEVQS